ncbi:MAG: hypothetical protein ABEK17_01685 [Candidatus Aenigmatarchaeota archaeon]
MGLISYLNRKLEEHNPRYKINNGLDAVGEAIENEDPLSLQKAIGKTAEGVYAQEEKIVEGTNEKISRGIKTLENIGGNHGY